MEIEWDFHRSAKCFVTALNKIHNDPKNRTSAPNNASMHASSVAYAADHELLRGSSSMVELNHWVLECHTSSSRGGSAGNGNFSNIDGGPASVYLSHPPILLRSQKRQNGDNNDHGTATNKSDELSRTNEAEDMIAMIAEEFGIEIDEATDPPPEKINNHPSYYKNSNIHKTNAIDSGTHKGTMISNHHDKNIRNNTHPMEYTEWSFSIIYHETWRVPTLYFQCIHLDGTPLSRKQVLDILLNIMAATTTNATFQSLNNHEISETIQDDHDDAAAGDDDDGDDDNDIMTEEDLWEFISQEEHPMTGVPSFFLHPCQTSMRMELLLSRQRQQRQRQRQQEYIPCHDAIHHPTTEDNNNNKNNTHRIIQQKMQDCPLLSWMSMILPVVGCKISPESFHRIHEIMTNGEHSL